jgi:hypothetical protein
MRPFWHAVARSADVGPGAAVHVDLLERRFLLRRAEGGGVEVGGTDSDEIDRADDAGAADHRAVEAYGFVWLCLERNGWERRSVPEIVLLDAGTHRGQPGEPFICAAQNLRYVEHVCELASASVIAGGVGSDDAAIDAVSVDGGAWALHFRAERSERGPDEAIGGYDVALPCSVLIETDRGGPAVFLHATPVGPYVTRVFWSSLTPAQGDVEVDDGAIVSLLRKDLPALEARSPMGLPLDAATDARLPLPQERFAVAFRGALAALGVPSVPSERRAPAGTRRPGAHGEEVPSRA